MLLKSIKDAKEWQDAQSLPSNTPPQQPGLTSRAPRAYVPPVGPTCHVDAAWRQDSGLCGIGGVFHGLSPRSLPIISFSRPFVSSALMAEALAIRSAVMMAASSNIRSLTVLSDSQTLIKLLKTKESRPALVGIIFDIYHFSSLFDSITFVYVPVWKTLRLIQWLNPPVQTCPPTMEAKPYQ